MINVFIFLFVLMLPFALSSQTRKAIPAGRYESLSGIKLARAKTDTINNPSNQLSIWQELQKNLATNREEFYYLKNYNSSLNLTTFIPSKNFREGKKKDGSFDLLVTDNLKRDKDVVKQLAGDGIVLFISTANLSDNLNQINGYNLLLFQTNKAENYYLLKLK